MIDGFSPTFAQFGTNIYMSDAVQQALKCIVDEVKKLNPPHIRMVDSEPVPVPSSTISAVLADPNPLMTTAEFLEKTTWLLRLNYNACIIPQQIPKPQFIEKSILCWHMPTGQNDQVAPINQRLSICHVLFLQNPHFP